jgi:hypothetical protein
MSALHIQRHSPASWAELFWQADRNWQGPIGILSMMYGKTKMGAKLSHTIMLFAFTCMIAIITPVLLAKAYPLQNIDVAVQVMRQLNIFYAPQIQAVEAYSQVAAGGGAWATGVSALNLYNSSIFIPVGTARVETEVKDFLFIGDTHGADGELAGIRTRGQCQIAVSGPVEYDTFKNQMCPQLPTVGTSEVFTVSWWNIEVSRAWCSTQGDFTDIMNTPSSSFASALIWLNATDHKLNETVQGIVMCNVTFSTGSAKLDGNDKTFSDFKEIAFYNFTMAQQGEPILHPLDAAMLALDYQSVHTHDSSLSAVIDSLGYNASQNGETLKYIQPSLDVMAEQIWQGAAHMGSALGLLSKEDGHAYPVTIHVSVTGRTIDGAIAKLAWVLCALWFVLLLGGTFILFRPTFGDSLNSYVAACLLAEYPALVDGYRRGPLDENMQMSARFKMVGDSEVEENEDREYADTYGGLMVGIDGEYSSHDLNSQDHPHSTYNAV